MRRNSPLEQNPHVGRFASNTEITVLRQKGLATRHVERTPWSEKNYGSSWITIRPFQKIRTTSQSLGWWSLGILKKKIMLKVDVYICLASCGSLFEVPCFQTFHFLSDPPPEKKNNFPPLKGLGCLREGLLFSIRKAWFLTGRLMCFCENWCVYAWEICLFGKLKLVNSALMPNPNPCLMIA